jgi:hypothetical protein
MKTMTILGVLTLVGLSSTTGQKVEFVLPEQERSREIHVETHKEKLEIAGQEVDFQVMKGAAACYRVSDHLFMVQARNFERGALFLWDAREKKVTGEMFDDSVPMSWPVAPKRRVIQMHGKQAGYYGVNPTSKNFVQIGTIESDQIGRTDLVGGNNDRLFFLKESTKPLSRTHSQGFGVTTLEVVQSGKKPIEIKVDLAGFVPVGSDSIRGNRLLLKRLANDNHRDTTKPPKYQLACWNFEKEGLEMLGGMEGEWVSSTVPPPKGGGELEIRWSPSLWIWWLPQEQEVKPIGYDRRHPNHWVDPATLKITTTKPEKAR